MDPPSSSDFKIMSANSYFFDNFRYEVGENADVSSQDCCTLLLNSNQNKKSCGEEKLFIYLFIGGSNGFHGSEIGYFILTEA